MSEKNGVYLVTSLFGVVGVVVVIGLIYFATAAQFQSVGEVGSSKDVAERIKPIGEVRLAGDEPVVAAAEPAGESATETFSATITMARMTTTV